MPKSKLDQLLDSLGEQTGTSIGFGEKSSQKKSPNILLGAWLEEGNYDKNALKFLDFVISKDKSLKTGSLSGLLLGSTDTSTKYAQFLLLNSAKHPAKVLTNSEKTPLGYVIDEKLIKDSDLGLKNSISEMPFSFVYTEYPKLSFPMSVGMVLELGLITSQFDNHIFLSIDGVPTGSDLEVLRDVPISALVLKLDKLTKEDLQKVKKTLDSLEPRKPKSFGTSAISMGGSQGSLESGFYEDDLDEE